jgi:hypothetical protein
LQSIADYDTVTPAVSSACNNNCVSGCTVLTCSCTQLDAVYWSSTTFVHFPAEALGVLDSVVTDLEKTLFAAVRAVRGGL